MTGREKALAVLEGENTEHPPLYAVIRSDNLVKRITGQSLTKENGLAVLGKAYRRHIDATRSIEPFWEEGPYTDKHGFIYRRTRWTEWVEKRPFTNVHAMEEFIKGEIERFRSWRPGANESEWLNECDTVERHLKPDVLLIGRIQIGSAPGSYFRDGLENFTYLLYEHPGLVAEWVKARHERNLRVIEHLAEPDKSPVEFLDADIAYKNDLLVAPHFLRESGWFRRISELADSYHSVGVKVIFHSDGDLRKILPELVRTGIDGLNPIETSAGLTLKNVREIVGNRLLLVGGIPNQVLIHGMPADVRSCISELERDMRGTPWWAGTSTEEFDTSMNPENVEVILAATGHASHAGEEQ